jgi:integrase
MIKVSVDPPSGEHVHWRLRYTDPDTGKRRYISSRTTDERKAERAAANLEKQLNSVGRTPDDMLWSVFRKRFEEEATTGMADKSRKAYQTVLNHIESIVNPHKLSQINSSNISLLVASWRGSGKSENSIRSYLSEVGGMLSWAKRMGFILKKPPVPLTHRAKKTNGIKVMKGRPITDVEFVTMLAVTRDVTGEEAAESWRHWLRGMWWSGLRLSESLELWWDRGDKLRIDLSGKHPMLRVRSELEKGNRDRVMPLAPEFCRFLLETPEDERTGPVFALQPIAVAGGRSRGVDDPEWVGTICRRIGKMAGVVVDVNATGKVKYASAHDLRRSFGTRWAKRVMPFVLMTMMRHANIQTTEQFYVDIGAEDISASIFAAVPSGGSTTNVSGSISGSKAKKQNASRKENTKGGTIKS